jgi:hypothetical protein
MTRITLLSWMPTALLLMGVERLLSCRRYLVAKRWIKVGVVGRSEFESEKQPVKGWRCGGLGDGGRVNWRRFPTGRVVVYRTYGTELGH